MEIPAIMGGRNRFEHAGRNGSWLSQYAISNDLVSSNLVFEEMVAT